MELIKAYLYCILNISLLIILLFKWIKYTAFKSSKNSFSNCFYYKNYDIVNSRNSDSKKNKITQNYLSLSLVCVFCLEIILFVLFSNL